MLTAEITCGWYTHTARLHSGTYFGFASLSGKKGRENTKILAPLSREHKFGQRATLTYSCLSFRASD